MKVKFDFEVDDRFNYEFTDEGDYIESARGGIELFLKPIEEDINKYNDGLVIIVASDKIDVLKEMNIEPNYNLNKDFPPELMEQIMNNLTYTKVMQGMWQFLKYVK